MKKEQLIYFLDNMIEAHKVIWENKTFVDDEDISVSCIDDCIITIGVVKIAEILGCAVTFEPMDSFATRICMKYKGVEFVEHKFN